MAESRTVQDKNLLWYLALFGGLDALDSLQLFLLRPVECRMLHARTAHALLRLWPTCGGRESVLTGGFIFAVADGAGDDDSGFRQGMLCALCFVLDVSDSNRIQERCRSISSCAKRTVEGPAAPD